MPQGSPLSSAPGIIVKRLEPITIGEKLSTPLKRVAVNSMAMKCSKEMVKVKQKEEKYEFGKSMYEYAKKMDGHCSVDHTKELTVSKSDGDLCGNKKLTIGDTKHIPHSRSQQQFCKTKHGHHPHQQCCTGFTSNKHRHHSNACEIV